MAADKNAIVKAFDDIGAKVECAHEELLPAFVLLAVARRQTRGPHRGGRQERTRTTPSDVGSLKDEFDATGFAPGCDPNTPPSFDVTRGDMLAPPAAGQGQGQEARREGGRARVGEGLRGRKRDGEARSRAAPAAASTAGQRARSAAARDAASASAGLHAVESRPA